MVDKKKTNSAKIVFNWRQRIFAQNICNLNAKTNSKGKITSKHPNYVIFPLLRYTYRLQFKLVLFIFLVWFNIKCMIIAVCLFRNVQLSNWNNNDSSWMLTRNFLFQKISPSPQAIQPRRAYPIELLCRRTHDGICSYSNRKFIVWYIYVPFVFASP